MSEQSTVLRTPEEWMALKHPDKVILDPDGWRGPNGRPFKDAIDEAEFNRRLPVCTIGSVDRRQPQPGVMHPVDQAFYELAVKERDYERRRVDRLTREIDDLRNVIAEAVRLDYGSPGWRARAIKAGCIR